MIAAAHGIRGALVGLILFMAADLGFYGLTGMQAPDSQPQVRLATHVAPRHDPAEGLATVGTNRGQR